MSAVRLEDNPDIWATEIIWSALKNTISDAGCWIIGGDFNTSETFDKKWQDEHKMKFGIRSAGNRKVLDRMSQPGLTECLRTYNDSLIPTFKHSNGVIVHQLDHLFVSNKLYPRLRECRTGDQSIVFGKLMSDHLPIITEFIKCE